MVNKAYHKAVILCQNKIISKSFIPEPPPSVDRPIFLYQAWFHREMK